MDINKPQQAICTSNLFPATAIMQSGTQTGSTAVSCAFPGDIVMVQLTEEITNTLSYRSVAAIIMSQALEAGRSAFTDLFTCPKVNDFPVWDFYAEGRIHHIISTLFH